MDPRTAPPRRLRLLITSVGSLVGQNILDSLEYPAAPRRHLVHVTGTNSLPESANNFRCDECYLVPPTASPDFPERMAEILRRTQPDLVLPARDVDTAAMWRLMHGDKSLPGKLPYGSLDSVLCALDKRETSRFCARHGLPFAETFYTGLSTGKDALRAFADRVGFPMIGKPSEGFASQGVFFLRDLREAESFAARDGVLLQEYLGSPNAMDRYFALLDGPKPLFAEAPDVSHHTCHIPIDASGKSGEVFVLRNQHNFGAVTRLQRVEHPRLEALAKSFAAALVAEGGFGPLSVQFREDRHGVPKAQEMNLRTTGSTFARLMMGQDEIGMLVRDHLGDPRRDWEFPLVPAPDRTFDVVVKKSLASYALSRDAVDALGSSGDWQA